MKPRSFVVLLGLILCLATTAALAEEVVELWRSPFGKGWSVSVDSSDGSCWAGTGGSVMHVAADGTVLSQTNHFGGPLSVSANSADGSCWVADERTTDVAHLAADGTELWRGSFGLPLSVSVNPADGSCWVADSGTDVVVHLAEDGSKLGTVGWFENPCSVAVNPTDDSCWIGAGSVVVHVAADGTELLRVASFYWVQAVAVDSTDGSCWVAHGGYTVPKVVHLSAEGAELGAWDGGDIGVGDLRSVSVYPTDGSCWVADAWYHEILRLAPDGTELWRGEGFSSPAGVSVDPNNGSCWVAEDPGVVHLAQDGAELWRGSSLGSPWRVSVNPTDGSCWVASGSDDGFVLRHLAEDGTELWRGGGLGYCSLVSVNPADGSCWVSGSTSVAHLAEDGTELWRGEGFAWVTSVSVNPADGSCWLADDDGSLVIHLSEEGAELGHYGFASPRFVSVNPTDGSCWVSGSTSVAHLAEDGTPLWVGAWLDQHHAGQLSVNPTDGSCWVVDHDHEMVVHLAEDGTELWRGGHTWYVNSVSTNPVDGSCWVTYRDCVVHFAEDGTELWRGENFQSASGVSVNPVDGSCWVADSGSGQVVHLGIVASVAPFSDVPAYHWACGEIGACVDAGIVNGYEDGSYRPEGAVTRDQMAAYLSRALAAGDENVPEPSGEPTFDDVSAEHWAYAYVEYAAAANIVTGYGDGLYRPEGEVDRGQMAVYIARSMVDPTGEDGLISYEPPATPTFEDVPENSWARVHVEFCEDWGVVQGYGDGLYHPELVVTRDQMAAYIARAFDLLP